MSEIEIDEQGRLHAMLCAYVLGEADAQERAEVEAALARDGGLREERARLEATIGLVQGSLGKDEVLSYDATREVTRAAELRAAPPATRAPAPWYRSGSLRAAASIVALVGVSYIGWQAFVVRDSARIVVRVDDATDGERERLQPDGTNKRDALRSKSEVESDVAGMIGGLAEGEEALVPAELGEVAKDLRDSVAPALGRELDARSGSPESTRTRGFEKNADELKKEEGPVDRFAMPESRPAGGPPGAGESPTAPARSAAPAPADGSSDLYALGYLGAPPAAPTAPPVSSERFVGLGATTAPVGGAGGGVGATDNPSLDLAVLKVEPTVPSGPTGQSGGHGSARPGGPASPGPSSPAASADSPGPAGASVPASKYSFADAAGVQPAKEKSRRGGVDKSVDAKVAELSDSWEAQTAGTSRFPALSDLEARDELEARAQGRLGVDQDDSRPTMSYAERQAHLEQIIAACRPLPGERPRDMFFRFFGDNAFEWTATDRLSTFAMDVDTASYTLARRYLVEGHLPEKAQIRTEEFVNYFTPDVAPPSGGNTFAIRAELAPGRYVDSPDKWMLRVAVRGQEVPVAERDPMALTFVVDVSGSMEEGQRLELVKQALRTLVEQLDGRDSISIVAFSADSRLILPMTSAAKRGLIESAIAPLAPGGGTNTEAGLRMGYEQALASLATHTNNRVVLLTDGVATVGDRDPAVISQQVERQRKAGIYLNTIGVGMNNVNDHLLEQLADKGDGLCNYVDDAQEMRHALVDNFMRTLVPIARDAKVQVEFDPAQVQSYRLLGYENRAIADHQFRDDRVDAGEINSGHQITALYEIVRVGTPPVANAPLAKVMVRYKPPHKDGVAQAASEEATEISQLVFARQAAGSFEATSFGYRRAVLAGQFAEFLRRSVHARGDSLDRLIEDTRKLAQERPGDVQVKELADMVLQSKLLLDADLARYSQLQARVDELRRHRYERERLAALQRESDREILQRIDQQVASLERALRDELEERRVK